MIADTSVSHVKNHRSNWVLPLFILGLSACGQSTDENEQSMLQRDAMSDASAESLRTELATGASSADSDGHWICDISTDKVRRTDVTLKLWKDGTGLIGNSLLTWETTGTSTARIASASGDLDLSKVRVFNQPHDQRADSERFDAISSAGESLSCLYNGPARNEVGLQDDQLATLMTTLQNDIENPDDRWDCTITDRNSNVVTTNYQFWPAGFGTQADETTSWYIYDEDILAVVSNAGYSEIYDVVAQSVQSPSTFSGALDGSSVSCVNHST